MRVDVPGSKPNLYLNATREQVCENISKLIRRYTDTGLTKKDIVILTVKTEEASILAGLSSVGNYKLSSELGSSNILFTSARKFKGLEAKVVIIVDVDETTFKTEEDRRVFYVGTSRAKHFLNIFVCLNDGEINKMAAMVNGAETKNPKASLGSNLKVKLLTDVV